MKRSPPPAGRGDFFLRMTAIELHNAPEPVDRTWRMKGLPWLPRVSHPIATALLIALAALVLAPLVSLVAIAMKGDADLWPHLAAYVLPIATLNTVLLLAGVALLCAVAGVGTAWIVTAY